jgi:crotonobetainyl-CoA:carnitine CoA-transferase CaiB-like acyl-CoA transferase
MSILDGVHVVEIPGALGAAWAGRNLADWGADVTLVEPHDGSPLRTEPPLFESNGETKSAAWLWLSLGKQILRLEDSAAARNRLVEQCGRADIVLVDTDVCERTLGVPPGELQSLLGGSTVVVAVSPFGLAGPGADWRGSDLGIQARGGWMGSVGAPDREPLRVGGEMTPRLAGGWATAAALAGLRSLERGGEPPFVDLSAQAVIASVTLAVVLMQHMGGMPGWTLGRRGNLWPIAVTECADGFIGCGPLTAAHWEMMCHMLGIPDVLEEPGGLEAAYWLTNGPKIYERVRSWYEARTRSEIMELAQTYRLPAASVQTIDERLECPQNEARGVWQTIDVDGHDIRVPRTPLRIREAAPAARSAPRTVDSLGLPAGAPRAAGDGARRPYEGLRVLDLTCFWAGPYGAMMLGALGADVIKVESVQRPDPFRYTGVATRDERWYERGPLWNDTNCNKRGLTLDLTCAEGLALFKRLVEQADVVMSNFSNRVMPNLGLDADSLLAINRRVIVVTAPAYGPGGPWENWVGFGRSFEQITGVVSMTGYSYESPENPGGFSDPYVGALVVAGVDLALRNRDRTGRGTHVELAQSEALDAVFAPQQIAIQMGAPVPGRAGNRHEWMAPHNSYQTAGADNWITIAVSSDEEYAALASGLGLPLGEPYDTVAGRKQHEGELDDLVAEAVRSREGAQLEAELQAARVMACRVVSPQEIEFDADLAARTFFEPVDRELTGAQPYRGLPFDSSAIDSAHRFGPPLLGQHTAEILSEMLSLTDAEIAGLRERKVIGEAPLAVGSG